jgi:hypothetical protein
MFSLSISPSMGWARKVKREWENRNRKNIGKKLKN